MAGNEDPVASWQRAAATYEESWGPVTGLFVLDLLDAVGVVGGSRLLDLACGTGAVAARAAERGAAIVGIDASSAMVRFARQRVVSARFVAGDASHLPLRPARFDGAAINFGLHHFADAGGALSEVARVLRPAARLGYTAWAAPDENPALARLNAIYESLLADGRDSTQAAHFAFGDRELYRAELGRVGYAADSASLAAVTHHWRPSSAEAVFQAEVRGGGRRSEPLARVGGARLETIRDAVCEAVLDYASPDGIAIPITAYVIAVERQGGTA